MSLFRLENLTGPAGAVSEEASVLLIPIRSFVKVYVDIGQINNADLAARLNTYIRGWTYGTLTRNEGHYIEIEVETSTDSPTTEELPNAQT